MRRRPQRVFVRCKRNELEGEDEEELCMLLTEIMNGNWHATFRYRGGVFLLKSFGSNSRSARNICTRDSWDPCLVKPNTTTIATSHFPPFRPPQSPSTA